MNGAKPAKYPMKTHDQIIEEIKSITGLDREAEMVPIVPIPLFLRMPPPAPQASSAESAGPTRQIGTEIQNEPTSVCPICLADSLATKRSHCLRCNNLIVKFERYCKDYMGSESSKFWEHINIYRKRHFIRSVNELATPEVKGQMMTPELKGQMRKFIYKELQTVLTTSAYGTDKLEQLEALRDCIGTGTFMEETDLRRKYRKDTYLLKMILEHARRFVCPVRVVVMYEDVVRYDLEDPAVDEFLSGGKRMMDFSAEESIRDTKKQKAAANATRTWFAKEIRATNHRQYLEDSLKFLLASGGALQTLKATITDLGQWIAPAANDRLNEIQVLHTSIQALCEDLADKQVCFDFPGFMETMEAFKEVFNFDKAAIDTQVEESLKLKIVRVRSACAEVNPVVS